MLVMGKLVHHYKLLPWTCAVIVYANPDSRAFVEFDGCRFKHMFVAFSASLNGFIFKCNKMLFVDGTHLSGPYEETMLGTVALDADNHMFDVEYAVVGRETNDNWLWFLTMLHDCLGGLTPIIISDRNKGLLTVMPLVFRKENHSYCVRHLIENLIGKASKLGIRRNASKELVWDMLNQIAYTMNVAKYESTMAKLRMYKRELAV